MYMQTISHHVIFREYGAVHDIPESLSCIVHGGHTSGETRVSWYNHIPVTCNNN